MQRRPAGKLTLPVGTLPWPVNDGRPGRGWRFRRVGIRKVMPMKRTPVFIPVVSATGTPNCVLDVAGLTEGRSRCARSRSYPRNGRSRLSSPDGFAAIPRGSRKSLPGRPPFHSGPFGVRVDRLRSVDRHRGRDGRGPRNQRNETHGYHRHLHLHRQPAFPAPSRPSTSTSRPSWSASKTPPTRARTSASSRQPMSNWAPPGRRSPARAATTSRSSWTIRASPLRSTPP